MSRSVAWQRTISDAVSWRQDQALNATIYILRETGPTGFLLNEEGETKKFKVLLGDPHKCTCPVFVKEKDLCKHICWVLLKKFKVPRHNEVTWQQGLVEREINEILRGSLARQEARPSNAARKYASAAREMGLDAESGRAMMEQRPIEAEDVCPICQEELLEKHQPVTFCKFGCGNNVHIKCMKVWAEHQKSQGKSNIECPFCRKDFGPLSLLKQELRNSSQRETRAERLNEHLGTTCRRCHVCPIGGKCYTCTTCTDYHLCQACFNTETHTEHAFQFRQKVSQRWRPAPNRRQGVLLPEAVINNLMSRDISDQDYDLLLQLDSQSDQPYSDLTEDTIRSFPMERIRNNGTLLAPGQQCCICLRGYEVGQFVRRLPCQHKFHRDCIDEWLIHRRPTCPVDGTTFTNQSVQEMNAANRARLRELQENRQQANASAVSNRRPTVQHGAHPADNLALEIPGMGIARFPGHSDSHRQRGVMEISATPLGRVASEHYVGHSGQNVRRQDQFGDFRHRNPSGSSSRARSGSDVSSVTFGDLVVSSVPQGLLETLGGDVFTAGALDDLYINMVAADNGQSPLASISHQQQFSRSHRQNSANNSTHAESPMNLGSAGIEIHSRRGSGTNQRASHLDSDSALTNTQPSSHTLLFDPSRTRNVLNNDISVDRPQDRFQRVQNKHGAPRRPVNPGHNGEGQGQSQGQAVLDINISGMRVNDTADRSSTGNSRNVKKDTTTTVIPTTTQPPSIPSGQGELQSGLEINLNGNQRTLLAVKPPSGDGNNGNRRQGRPQNRPLYRPGAQRDRSSSRERSRSQEGATPPQKPASLYIGQDPSSLAGFNCEFLLSSNQSRSSKSLRQQKAARDGQSENRDSTAQSDPVNDISLSGTQIQSAASNNQ